MILLKRGHPGPRVKSRIQKPRPRAVIFRLLKFATKEDLLRRARSLGQLKWGPDQIKISLFDDIPKEVVDFRKGFIRAMA